MAQKDDDQDEGRPPRKPTLIAATAAACCTLVIVGCWARYRRHKKQSSSLSSHRTALEAPLSLLYQAIQEKSIEKALLSGSVVFYLLKKNNSPSSWKRSLLPPNHSNGETLLLQHLLSSCPNVATLPPDWSQTLATPLLAALPFVYLYFVYRMMQSTNTNSNSIRSSNSTAPSSNNTAVVSFDNVAGLDSIVTELSQLVECLLQPTRYHVMGARAPRAILLHGPPGSGKTLLAQAVAGQAKVDCFLACSASEFVEVYVGQGAARVRSLFDKVRAQAKRNHAQCQGGGILSAWLPPWMNPPSNRHSRPPTAILFIDELDALAKTRSTSTLYSNDEREQTLNQLLTEMDGFDTSAHNDNVTLVVMAASNRVDVLDPAILRRFDQQFHVGYPNAQGRKAILQVHAKQVSVGDNIDWDRLARDEWTRECSGADLRNVMNDAALLAVREGSTSVQQGHLEHAARRLQQMKQASSSRQSVGRLTTNA